MIERDFGYPDYFLVQDSENFDILFERTLVVLKRLKEESPDGRLGYVSGIISSDGPEFLEKNRKILQEKTEKYRKEHDFPIFSANDIFTPDFVDRLGHDAPPYVSFWRKILNSGLVTDVVMTKGWKRSKGATDEHTTAEINSLNIIYEEG